MRLRLREILPSLGITILFLVIFEIVSTALFPALGVDNFRLPINILIVLYLGFKLNTPYLPILIFLIQIFHGAFSVEGWAIGTFVGVMISIIVNYLKELLHLSSAITTIIITQVFQVVWFIFVAFIYYFKTSSFDLILGRLNKFIPESIVLSILAPVLFGILDKVWRLQDQKGVGAQY